MTSTWQTLRSSRSPASKISPHTASWRDYIASWEVRWGRLLDSVEAHFERWLPGTGDIHGLVRSSDKGRASSRLADWEGLVLYSEEANRLWSSQDEWIRAADVLIRLPRRGRRRAVP